MEWELLICRDCGHEFVRPSEGRESLPCQCGGGRNRFALERGELLELHAGRRQEVAAA